MKSAYLALALLAATPALAQNEEIIVTGSRRSGSLQAQEVQLPVITLRRAADFLVQPAHHHRQGQLPQLADLIQ